MKAGARREEIEAARARVAAVDAQIAIIAEGGRRRGGHARRRRARSPSKLVNVGEIVAPRAPLAVMTDLDHAWGEVFVDEPLVPRLALGQPATLYNDAGGEGLPGKVTFISPKAEFTPRNVQTAEERSRLVYRIKVTVDNSKGVLKPGMPVEAETAAADDARALSLDRVSQETLRRTSPRCPTCPSTSSPARCSGSSGPTARARPRRFACCAGCCTPTAARSASWGTTR